MLGLSTLQVVGGILVAGLLVGGVIGGCSGYKVGHYQGYRACERDHGIDNGWFEPAPIEKEK